MKALVLTLMTLSLLLVLKLGYDLFEHHKRVKRLKNQIDENVQKYMKEIERAEKNKQERFKDKRG